MYMDNYMDTYMSSKKSSQILGISKKTLYNWSNKGYIDYIRYPNGYKY
jgi:predicted site-specific integrase-resolvase